MPPFPILSSNHFLLPPALRRVRGRLANITVDDFMDHSDPTVRDQLNFILDGRVSSLSHRRCYAVLPSRRQEESPRLASIHVQLKRPRSPTLIPILLSILMERLSMVSFLSLPRT